MLYIVVILLITFLSYWYDYQNHTKGKNLWYFILLIVFILIAGLRYRLGVDSIRYESTYASTPDLYGLTWSYIKNSRFAIGYIYFTSFCRTISNDFTCLQILQALYVNCVCFWFFKKYSKKIFIAILIYFVFLYSAFMCEVLREACAVSTFLLAWPYFLNGKWIRYYILAVLCLLFHNSGIIALLLPVLYLPGLRKFFIIDSRTIFMLIAIYVIGCLVGVALLKYIEVLGISDSISERANIYASDELGGKTLNIKGVIGVVVRYIFYPYVAVLAMSKNNYLQNINSRKDFECLQFMLTLCFIFAVLSVPISIFYRYNNYFFPFAILAISQWSYSPFYKKFGRLRRKVKYSFAYWMIFLSPFFLFQIYGYVKINPNNNMREISRYYPYSSRLDPYKDYDRERLYHFYHAY